MIFYDEDTSMVAEADHFFGLKSCAANHDYVESVSHAMRYTLDGLRLAGLSLDARYTILIEKALLLSDPFVDDDTLAFATLYEVDRAAAMAMMAEEQRAEDPVQRFQHAHHGVVQPTPVSVDC